MKTKRCLECGQEATVFFGFTTPCKRSLHHHLLVDEDTTLDHEAEKLKDVLSRASFYERKLFFASKNPLVLALRGRLGV